MKWFKNTKEKSLLCMFIAESSKNEQLNIVNYISKLWFYDSLVYYWKKVLYQNDTFMIYNGFIFGIMGKQRFYMYIIIKSSIVNHSLKVLGYEPL